MKRWTSILGIVVILGVATATAQPPKGAKGKGPRLPPPRAQISNDAASDTKHGADSPSADEQLSNAASIQWFATLERGLAEAKRTGKPILFASAAPHCAGVSGMW